MNEKIPMAIHMYVIAVEFMRRFSRIKVLAYSGRCKQLNAGQLRDFIAYKTRRNIRGSPKSVYSTVIYHIV
jgi:hypothetical protein